MNTKKYQTQFFDFYFWLLIFLTFSKFPGYTQLIYLYACTVGFYVVFISKDFWVWKCRISTWWLQIRENIHIYCDKHKKRTISTKIEMYIFFITKKDT